MSTTRPQTADLTAPRLEEIREVVEHYAEVLRDGSVDALRKAFHPQAIMSGYFNDDLMIMDMEGFAGLVRSIEPPSKTGEPFRYDLESAQVTGDIATVEITEYSFLGHDFRTCFHMTRIDGRWQITAKLFTTLRASTEEPPTR